MDFKYSDKIRDLNFSVKPSTGHAIIPFSSSNPSPELYPINDFERIISNIFKENPLDAFESAGALGYEPLCTLIRGLLFQKNCLKDHDKIAVTSGTMQSLDLICRTLCNFGDTVICEEPTSSFALKVLKGNGLNIVGIPITCDGMDIDRLSSALIRYPNTRFIYINPDFQNPSGITTSEEKRKIIYNLAHKYDVAIVENSLLSDLRFGGVDISPIKAFDKDGRVIYISGFSKILSPAVKVGYVCADELFIAKLILAKHTCDLQASTLMQVVIGNFFNELDYFDYTYKLSSFYRKKCSLMLDNLKFDLPESISFTEPEGGFYILGTLPKSADLKRFCSAVYDKGADILPCTECTVSKKTATNSFRLSFSCVNDDQIIDGIKILSDAAKAFAL